LVYYLFYYFVSVIYEALNDNLAVFVTCHHRSPSSRVFTTMYPQPLMLSPGNAFSLPVSFRPLENVLYEDSVEFVTNVSMAVLTISE